MGVEFVLLSRRFIKRVPARVWDTLTASVFNRTEAVLFYSHLMFLFLQILNYLRKLCGLIIN